MKSAKIACFAEIYYMGHFCTNLAKYKFFLKEILHDAIKVKVFVTNFKIFLVFYFKKMLFLCGNFFVVRFFTCI